MTTERADAERVSEARLGWLSFATMFVIGTDTFLVAPLLPTLRAEFDVDVPASGPLVSAYAVGYIVCALVAGPISDRVDRRRMLLTGMGLFTLLTTLCGAAWGFWPMVGFRFLAGAAAAIATPQVWASIPQLVPGARLVRVMGRATAGLAVAQVAGIPIGSFLAAGSWRWSFVFVGAAAAVVTVLLFAGFPTVPRAVPARPGRQDDRGGYAYVLRSRRLLLALVAYFVFQTGNFAALSFFGSWFARDFDLDSTGIGLTMIAIGAGNAAGSLFGHFLTARLGRARSLWVGILAMSVGYAAVAVTGVLPLAVALLTAIMAVAGFLFPVLMAAVQEHAGPARGTVSSLANIAMYAGTTLGVAVAAPVFDATREFTGVAAVTVAACLVALVVFVAAEALDAREGHSRRVLR
ncbi:MFS transporter [Microbacterium sp.]|uniref:MFS transporter n=1 Tax=Microbacterium sp. TaxID=51671 RepID=UPI003C75600A